MVPQSVERLRRGALNMGLEGVILRLFAGRRQDPHRGVGLGRRCMAPGGGSAVADIDHALSRNANEKLPQANRLQKRYQHISEMKPLPYYLLLRFPK